MKVKKSHIILMLLTFLILSGINLRAQDKNSEKLLTLERIFASQEFASEHFGPAHWLKDGSSYTVLENSATSPGSKDIVLYSAVTGTRKVLVPASLLIPQAQTSPLTVDDYSFSEDMKLVLIYTNSQRVWRQKTRGDYWVLDLTTRQLKKLGNSLEPTYLQFARFSADGRQVAYVYKNNIYVEDLFSGNIINLTDDGSDTIINGTFDWVYEEEFSLRDGFRWSPDGNRIAFWQLDTSSVKDFYLLNNTDQLYPKIIAFKYPKVGESNSACLVGVLDIETKKVVWLKVPGDPRNNYIPWMEWAGNSREIILQHLNRLQNRNEVMLANAFTGGVRTVFADEDKAWVEVDTDLTLYDKGNRFLFTSERDGWKHVYSIDRSGIIKLLTPGDYDVIGINGFDEKRGWLYFTASPENPTQQYLYRIRIDKPGKPERVTPLNLPGTHSYQLSPSCQFAFHTYSRFGQPPVTDLVELPRHRLLKTLVENRELAARINSLKKSPVEFFRVDIGNVLLDGWLIKPPDFDLAKKYPLFIYVYGEPAGQTVRDAWGGNAYLWHLMLAQQGYLVVSIDNRGTPAPRGRDWRKIIYRQVGILASADQAAATRALIKKWTFIDPERIGIWGWSGGGQMTLNALFRYPDLYKMGIAVAFVSDQRLYDTIYQERYMGLPQDNEEGYRNGSPITFAHQLKGKLLIIHGTGDDNVHFQSFEMLVNELIANDKLFSMMIYPNRSHGIYEGKNTTLHLYRTMTDFLKRNL